MIMEIVGVLHVIQKRKRKSVLCVKKTNPFIKEIVIINYVKYVIKKKNEKVMKC
jgi:hypothetical protein